MEICELSDDSRPEWDTYVCQAPAGLPQQLTGWRDVLRQYPSHYLLARQTGQVVGVLPLLAIRSWLLGSRLTTLPGGLCADSDDVALALLEAGQKLGRRLGLPQLVIHDSRQVWPGLASSSYHVHWLVDLRPGSEAFWQGLDGNIRRQVRMARRNGLTVEIDRSGRSLPHFYDLFSRFTHQAGTPNFSLAFLQKVVASFPAGFNILLVRQQEKVIGGYFQLEMGRRMFGLWGAALPQYLELRPVYLAYWEILAEAMRRDFHWLDMGRSPAGSNASKFKGQWGGTSFPIYQLVFGRPAAPPLPANHTWFTRLWPKLPYPLAQYLGPKLRHHIPFG